MKRTRKISLFWLFSFCFTRQTKEKTGPDPIILKRSPLVRLKIVIHPAGITGHIGISSSRQINKNCLIFESKRKNKMVTAKFEQAAKTEVYVFYEST